MARKRKSKTVKTADMITECQMHLVRLGCDMETIESLHQLNWIVSKLLQVQFDWWRPERTEFRERWPEIKPALVEADDATVAAALRAHPPLKNFWPDEPVQTASSEEATNVINLADWRRRSPSPPPREQHERAVGTQIRNQQIVKTEAAIKKTYEHFINDPLTTDRSDPANARYLVALDDPEQEDTAHLMADAIYCAQKDEFSESITQEQADDVYEQCPIDSRHMLCDPDYESLFI